MFENLVIPPELVPLDPRFGCGPSLISLDAVEALRDTKHHLLGTSHRKEGVRSLIEETAKGLKSYFNLPDDYLVVMGNGGATLLFDMISLGLVERVSGHHTCGEFSGKWYKACAKVPWLEAIEKKVDYGEGHIIADIPRSDLIAMTLNETSTGVQCNKIQKIGDEKILAVDATSGGGQIRFDVSESDIFFFSPQKIFGSEGGLWVAIMSPKAQERALKIEADKSRYIPEIMNFKQAIDNAKKFQTYNTPSVSTLFFLNEQVKDLNKHGYESICRMAEEKANLVYNWAKEKNYLSAYVKDENYQSKAVACIDVDEKISVNDLLKKLHEQGIVYGIESYRKLGRNQFRIALFHNIKFEDLEKLTKLLSYAMEK